MLSTQEPDSKIAAQPKTCTPSESVTKLTQLSKSKERKKKKAHPLTEIRGTVRRWSTVKHYLKSNTYFSLLYTHTLQHFKFKALPFVITTLFYCLFSSDKKKLSKF